jgi:polar amino acid transport system substrate-binding protein
MKYFTVFMLCLIIPLASLASCSTNSATFCNTPANKLRIITEEYPPFNFTSQDGTITGQSTEIVRELIKSTSSQATFEMMPWSQGYELVQKEANTAIFSTSRTRERENLFKWVGPIGTELSYFYVRKDSNIKVNSLEEAKKVGSIAVYQDDAHQQYLLDQGFTNLDISKDIYECLKKLIDSKVDMWLGTSNCLYYVAIKAKVNQTEVKPIMFGHSEDDYIAFNKTVPDTLINLWQSNLDAIKQKGLDGKSSLFEQITSSYATPQYVEKSISPEAVIQLVEKTARDVEQDAQDTFDKINNQEPPYFDKDNILLYVFIYDSDLTQPANADNPAQVGRNFKGVPDAVGNLFRDQIAERSASEGSGWQDYVFTMPDRIGLFYKAAYFKRVTGSDGKQYIVCSGRYKISGE